MAHNPLAHNQSARYVPQEPGGILLILLDLSDLEIKATLSRFAEDTEIKSVTVLAHPRQKNHLLQVNEVWWLDRLGPLGLIAMLRRISWRRFEAVYQPRQAGGKSGYAWIKFFVLPRPKWFFTAYPA